MGSRRNLRMTIPKPAHSEPAAMNSMSPMLARPVSEAADTPESVSRPAITIPMPSILRFVSGSARNIAAKIVPATLIAAKGNTAPLSGQHFRVKAQVIDENGQGEYPGNAGSQERHVGRLQPTRQSVGCVDRVQSTDGGRQQAHRHTKKYSWLGLHIRIGSCYCGSHQAA